MAPLAVEGRPALWVDPRGHEGAGAPGYFVLLETDGGKIKTIRDFRYARYAASGTSSFPPPSC
jgi:RNA polymerase sigma-70 factor (ECF subfamily)